MKTLIWKEWREHLKWVLLPGLVILLVFSIEKPEEPMPWSTAAYYYCLTAIGFGAALGFLQIVFEAHGDKRRCSCTGRSARRASSWPRRSPASASTCWRWGFLLFVWKPGRRGRATCRRPIIGG